MERKRETEKGSSHLVLTSASSTSLMFLMTSPGNVTKTDLTGRLHPSCKLIPKTKQTARAAQNLMMRSSADF